MTNLAIIPTQQMEQPVPISDIKAFADAALDQPQIDCPLKHLFSPGVYIREIFMPANTFVIGNEHLTEHFNIVLTGKARVMVGDQVMNLHAPCSFVSKPGVMKVLLILEDMIFMTVHPTMETDIDTLERMLFVKTKARQEYEKQSKQLKEKAA